MRVLGVLVLSFVVAAALAADQSPQSESESNEKLEINSENIEETLRKLARRNEKIAEKVRRLPMLIKKALLSSSSDNQGRVLIVKQDESSSSSSESDSRVHYVSTSTDSKPNQLEHLPPSFRPYPEYPHHLHMHGHHVAPQYPQH